MNGANLAQRGAAFSCHVFAAGVTFHSHEHCALCFGAAVALQRKFAHAKLVVYILQAQGPNEPKVKHA